MVGGVVFSSGQTWHNPGLVSLFPKKKIKIKMENEIVMCAIPLFCSPTSCVSATTTTTTTRPRRTSSSTTTPTSPTPTTPADTSPTRRYSEEKLNENIVLRSLQKEKVTVFLFTQLPVHLRPSVHPGKGQIGFPLRV